MRTTQDGAASAAPPAAARRERKAPPPRGPERADDRGGEVLADVLAGKTGLAACARARGPPSRPILRSERREGAFIGAPAGDPRHRPPGPHGRPSRRAAAAAALPRPQPRRALRLRHRMRRNMRRKNALTSWSAPCPFSSASSAASACTAVADHRPPAVAVGTKTKICDTPRARKDGSQPPIVTVLYCPGTSTCPMHPIQYNNRNEVVVHNAHLQTLAPQLEVANSVVWRFW
jgi:hypothetical protein